MKEWLVAATALAFGAATAVQAADTPPPWAYGFTTPVPPGTPPAEPTAAGAGQRDAAHHPRVEILVHPRADRRSVWSGRLVPRGPSGDAGDRRQGQGIRAATGVCLQPVPLSQWQGPSGERQHHWPHLRIFHAADDGFP